MCQRVHPLSLLRSATPAPYPYTACRYWFTYVGPRCCTPDQGTTCSTTRPVADLKWVRSGATSQQSGL
ncbi:hypothetical protein DMN57_03075 [Escherichia coli]|nr:hypothetical protein [Escherichia coli]